MSDGMHISRLVAEWEQSGVQSKQVAAWLALTLRNQQPGTAVQSKEKIATEYGVHASTAQRARLLVQGMGIAYKSGRHLYVSETARGLEFVMADDDTYSDIWIDHLWQVHAELAREKVIRYLTDDGQEAQLGCGEEPTRNSGWDAVADGYDTTKGGSQYLRLSPGPVPGLRPGPGLPAQKRPRPDPPPAGGTRLRPLEDGTRRDLVQRGAAGNPAGQGQPLPDDQSGLEPAFPIDIRLKPGCALASQLARCYLTLI